MGLDMYLEKRKKAEKDDRKWEEIAYWRKANQIRKWFADNLERFNDNGSTILSKKNLEDLLEKCKYVLENKDEAANLLPTSSGFFFGSGIYDELYFDDIKETVDMITKVLEETDWDNEEVIYFEWY